ncbi:unnamed protein product [Orchesella dallaii]|uniref:Mediator of RNA polymerase II transcription subunit 8 n=1 Tax=Orchesella dallaii TaxID=48710 RepID=A0ABP1QY76_9HEXA
MGTREEKQLEFALDLMLQRVNEMKASLSSLIMKLEHDHQNVNFPVFLDSFSVISGQMNTLMRLLRSDKVPLLKALTVLPLSLNPEHDQALLTMTEGRLNCFNHEVVPDYLRTKPVPDVENKHVAVEMRASQANQDIINKQAAQLTKMANHAIELITTARDDWEASERGGIPATFSNNDTQELVAALHTGKAFKALPGPPPVRQPATSTSAPTTQPTVKAPGPIKTNIKSAASHL